MSFRDVGVHVWHETATPEHILFSLNASVVSLCHVEDHLLISPKHDEQHQLPKLINTPDPIVKCLGFGKSYHFYLSPCSSYPYDLLM